MVKTLNQDNRQSEKNPETSMTRSYEAEEFEADTIDDRPVTLLAERRRQFLAGLKARQTETNSLADK